MIFGKEENDLVPYTVSECSSCGDVHKRPFREGDYVYGRQTCRKCDKTTTVSAIYGEQQDP